MFDRQKFIAIVTYICIELFEKESSELEKIFWALYYIEMNYYELHETSITDEKYIKGKTFPIPLNGFYLVLKIFFMFKYYNHDRLFFELLNINGDDDFKGAK